jgi:dihydrofolate reductase
MRKVVVHMSVSLDGYMEGPGRDISWHRVDDELHQYFNDKLRDMGAFLSGRRTYELMADYWPTADDDPDSPPPVVEFARIWRGVPKIVYSRTLQHAQWGTTIVRDVVPDEVMALKEQPGGDLALGGADLIHVFRQHDLVDEYRIYVHPVLIGQGKPLFWPLEGTADLALLETRSFSNGVVLMHFERARAH